MEKNQVKTESKPKGAQDKAGSMYCMGDGHRMMPRLPSQKNTKRTSANRGYAKIKTLLNLKSYYIRNYLNHKNCCCLPDSLTSTDQGRGRFFLTVESADKSLQSCLPYCTFKLSASSGLGNGDFSQAIFTLIVTNRPILQKCLFLSESEHSPGLSNMLCHYDLQLNYTLQEVDSLHFIHTTKYQTVPSELWCAEEHESEFCILHLTVFLEGAKSCCLVPLHVQYIP